MTAALLTLVLCAAPVALEPAALTFGPGPAALDILAPGAAAVSVRAANGAGQVSSPVAAGEGRFRAQYTFPAERFPQVALLLVEARTAAGEKSLHWVALPLRANASLKIETKPLASVTVAIGAARFGPVLADAKGRATIPAQVPPGYASAEVVAVDRAGNSTTTALDLGAQPFPRAAAALVSAAARPDVPAELQVFAIEPTGAPLADAAAPQVKAELGACEAPVPRGQGVFTVTYRAPRALSRAADRVEVSVSGSPVSSTEVPLRAGPAARVTVALSQQAYVAGSGARIGVTATVVDDDGNPAPGAARPALAVDFGRLEESAGGLAWVVPDAFEGRTALRVQASADGVAGEATLPLEAGPPQRARLALPAHVSAGAAVEGRLSVVDAWGNRVKPDAVQVVSSAGRAATVSAAPEGDHRVRYEAARDDAPGPTALQVRSGDAALSQARLEVLPFERPWALSVGAFAAGAWNLMQARAFSPRLGLGVRLGRSGFELGAEGAFAYYPRLEGAPTTDGLDDASIESSAWSVAAAVRHTWRLSPLWSAHLAGAVGTQHTASAFTVPGLEPTRAAFWSVLLRGGAGAGLHVLFGRVLLQLEYAWVPAPANGRVRGNLGGLGLALGYVASF